MRNCCSSVQPHVDVEFIDGYLHAYALGKHGNNHLDLQLYGLLSKPFNVWFPLDLQTKSRGCKTFLIQNHSSSNSGLFYFIKIFSGCSIGLQPGLAQSGLGESISELFLALFTTESLWFNKESNRLLNQNTTRPSQNYSTKLQHQLLGVSFRVTGGRARWKKIHLHVLWLLYMILKSLNHSYRMCTKLDINLFWII